MALDRSVHGHQHAREGGAASAPVPRVASGDSASDATADPPISKVARCQRRKQNRLPSRQLATQMAPEVHRRNGVAEHRARGPSPGWGGGGVGLIQKKTQAPVKSGASGDVHGRSARLGCRPGRPAQGRLRCRWSRTRVWFGRTVAASPWRRTPAAPGSPGCPSRRDLRKGMGWRRTRRQLGGEKMPSPSPNQGRWEGACQERTRVLPGRPG